MSGIIDYIKWRGDLPFGQFPLNELDAVIFTMISYWPLKGIVPEEIGSNNYVTIRDICNSNKIEKFPSYCSPLHKDMKELLASSSRFADVKAFGYRYVVDKEAGLQFSALVFSLNWHTLFIAIMGTDDSIIGWKENMDLAYHDEVPSQRKAVEYIKEVSKKFLVSRYYIGGHSKGGNLAVYGSAFSEWPEYPKIIKIFNFDGPGFNMNVLATPNMQKIKEKVCKFVPQNSLVGLLLEQSKDYQVVQSIAKGPMQHDPFSWDAEGTSFIYLDSLSESGEESYETIKKWIDGMSYEEKEEFIKVLYSLVDEFDTLDDLFEGKNLYKIIRRYIELSKDKKKIIGGVVGALSKNILDGWNSNSRYPDL